MAQSSNGAESGEATQTAVFGGGCFWCIEAVFERLRGVVSVMPGYAGGRIKNPNYRMVCGGDTGHAEVLRIEFDPAKISYHDLLTVFFGIHDPTTLNRQGNDTGTQYRSLILYTDEAQKNEAQSVIDELKRSGAFAQPIVTDLKPLEEFYPAEDYHRHYYANNPGQFYCQLVIDPKMQKATKQFRHLLEPA